MDNHTLGNPTPPGGPLRDDRPDDDLGLPPDYPRPKSPLKSKLPGRRPTILLVVLALAALAGGLYWFLLRPKPAPQPTQPTESAQTESTTQQIITNKTKNHSSSNFSLSFDYPEDWTVTEEAGSGQLTVRSPSLQLKDSNEQAVSGQIVFTIRSKTQPLPEFDGGNAVAALPSEKIAYTKPSPSQRGSTYLSFLRYAKSAGGLDGLYITGDTGYQTDQAIPKADFVPVDPVISITFVNCPDAACADSTPLSIATSSWDDDALADPLKNILASLVIR